MTPTVTQTGLSVDVRTKGRWIRVPAIQINGDTLLSTGKALKIAKIRGEEMRVSAIEDPETYAAVLRGDAGRSIKADIFTFGQRVSSAEPLFSFPMELESVAAISLSTFEQWWEGLPQETRKNVRRSQKRGVAVTVRELDADVVEGIRAVNDDSPMRQGVKNAYFGLTAEATWKRYGEFPDRSNFICAHSGDEMIGFLHLVYLDGIAAILNLTVKSSESDKRPANALVAKAVELCVERGFSYITYGLLTYGNKRDSSLKEFKLRNGFDEIMVPRYFVPITMWGRLGVKLKLHRGLVEILPNWVIANGLRARAWWYTKVVYKPV